jgi:hypothetical protein
MLGTIMRPHFNLVINNPDLHAVIVGTPRFVKLKAGGLLAGLVIVVLIAMAAWLYFLARLAWDLAIWIFS